jgi:uracil phosphoribosyltransferase
LSKESHQTFIQYIKYNEMNIVNFSPSPSLITHYLAQLRNVEVQRERMRFRKNLERISFCMAYEISKQLQYDEVLVQSPLAKAQAHVLVEKPVIAFVLRAGLAMHRGFVDAFDEADHCFISAYREEGNPEIIRSHIDYIASPDLTDRTVLLVDPMLATGSSLVGGYAALRQKGEPRALHVACIVAAPQGIETIKRDIPQINTLWVASIDDDLDERAYIVPGLGDAGDLAFGEKI